MDAKNRLKITIVAAAMIVLAPASFVFSQTATSTTAAFDLQSIIRQLQEQIKSLLESIAKTLRALQRLVNKMW